MKKFIAIAFIAASFAACNNSGKSDKPAEDTTKKVDTSAPAPTPAPTGGDSTGTNDSTPKGDSSAPKM